MRPVTSKAFALLVAAAYFSALLLLFVVMRGAPRYLGAATDWRKGHIVASDPRMREEKSLYVGQPDLPYDAYVIGGSKAGFLNTRTIDACTDEHFYNFFFSNGNFRDYDASVDYLLRTHGKKVREIVLHLSTYETRRYAYGSFVPSPMQKQPLAKLRSRWQVFKATNLDISSLWLLIRVRRGTADVFMPEDGGQHISIVKNAPLFRRDPDAYVRASVFAQSQPVGTLFTADAELPACKKNIAALRRIKEKCDENGTKLTLVIGAHYIGVLPAIWGGDFEDYMRGLVSVCGEVWNFCGINEVNMNPYNFFNAGHFWDFVGDKMIETMYAASPAPNTSDMDAFGVLLTADNIERFIARQREKWQQLKAEYDDTGTVRLRDMSDASFLGENRLSAL